MADLGIKQGAEDFVFSSHMKDLGCGQINESHIGKTLKIAGWVETVRDHGGVKFVDLVDMTGEVQVVVKSADDLADVGDWWVIQVEGEVRRRPEGTENPKINTGNLEVVAKRIKVLSVSDIPPFSPREKKELSEELRLKYRYIDLRREKMRQNIIMRHRMVRSIRTFMWSQGFLEIETPFLTKSTPEGARDFLVPSRLQKGKFYALPQSPQLFKQILQIAGFERYFQIVRCFRDEDLRADRQPEFTQIDIEMSFVNEEDIMSLVERLIKYVYEKELGIELQIPFPRISYREAIEIYGTDKPDIRIPFRMHDISGAFSDTKLDFVRSSLGVGGKVLAFGVETGDNIQISKSYLVSLERFAKTLGAGGLMWFVIRERNITASPVLRYIGQKEKEALSSLFGKDCVSFAIADTEEKARSVLGRIMKKVADDLKLLEGGFHFIWVVDFPLFSWDEAEKRYVSEHHPFTSPREEDMHLLDSDPLRVRARAYDIVLNGEEIGGGSIRIHDRELQRKIFRILNIPDDEVSERFGWFLFALGYGAPPHGGIAIGLDRLVAIMLGEENIREVIPFPKTQSGTCPLTGAPSYVKYDQLKELGIDIADEKE